MLKTVSNNEAIFKDIRNGKIHYSTYFNESSLGFHKTIESQPPIHVPIAKVEVDWKSLIESILLGIKADWKTIFQTVNVQEPKWANLQVDYLPVQVLKELLPPTRKGYLLLNDEHFEKLLSSLEALKLRNLADRSFGIGTGSGYLVLNYGAKGFLFDTDKFSEIFSQCISSSVGKIRLNHLT